MAKMKTAKTKNANKTAAPKKAARSYARKKYQWHFLSEVIARVDFSPVLELSDENPPMHVPRLKPRFPVREKVVTEHPQIKLSHSEGQAEAAFTVVRVLRWQFHNRAKDRYYELTNGSLLVRYTQYDCYERLRDDFIPVVEHVLGSVEEVAINRIGLRYINSIKLNERSPTSWEKYLKADLLATFNLADDVKTVSRAFNTLEFNYGNDMQMRFQYGMPNPDYPARIKNKQFILDWDAYAAGVGLSVVEVGAYLDGFHEKVNASFEEVITDELRKKMGPIE
jgi:uncharacterized protein (TIGR04255 family)